MVHKEDLARSLSARGDGALAEAGAAAVDAYTQALADYDAWAAKYSNIANRRATSAKSSAILESDECLFVISSAFAGNNSNNKNAHHRLVRVSERPRRDALELTCSLGALRRVLTRKQMVLCLAQTSRSRHWPQLSELCLTLSRCAAPPSAQ